MSLIYFNPWEQKHKEPFGAIMERSFTKFMITVADENVVGVNLVIGKENGEQYQIPMDKNEETNDFRYDFFFNDGKGLYFYYFEIIYWSQNNEEYHRYYGACEKGGPGVVCENQEVLQAFQVTCYSQEETAPEWYQEAIFYQIFPDRFYNGNPDGCINAPKPNTFIYGTKEDEPMYIKNEAGEVVRWDFFGGNLAGIKAKIPYLLELGINGIYLNPIFLAHSNHRYDTADYLEIDPILGNEALFKDLIDSLHEAGIRLILDGVFSHVGRNSRYFNFDGSYGEEAGAYRNINSPYYPWFTFTSYPDKYRAWWGVYDLPEVNKENADFQDFIYGNESVLSKWNQFGIDGWRLDVADELPDSFIHGIRCNLDQFPEKMLIGEVWEDASNKIAYDKRREYVLGEHLQGVMNYPFRNTVMALLNGSESPENIVYAYTKLQENYPPAVFSNSFNNIGTHDTERILSILEGDVAKLGLAFAMMQTFPGVPCLYYGDEAGLTGGKDPENRKYFPWGKMNKEIFALCQHWIGERQKHDVLKKGQFRLLYTDKMFGVLRYDQEQYYLLIINPTDGLQNISGALLQSPLALPFTQAELNQIVPEQIIGEKATLTFSGTFKK